MYGDEGGPGIGSIRQKVKKFEKQTSLHTEKICQMDHDIAETKKDVLQFKEATARNFETVSYQMKQHVKTTSRDITGLKEATENMLKAVTGQHDLQDRPVLYQVGDAVYNEPEEPTRVDAGSSDTFVSNLYPNLVHGEVLPSAPPNQNRPLPHILVSTTGYEIFIRPREETGYEKVENQ